MFKEKKCKQIRQISKENINVLPCAIIVECIFVKRPKGFDCSVSPNINITI